MAGNIVLPLAFSAWDNRTVLFTVYEVENEVRFADLVTWTS